jgi:Arc/MetJ family transcription regulator
LTLTSNDANNDAMRTTINIDDELLARATELTGVKERATLIRMALEGLVAKEAARRLARLGGSDPDAWAAPRRRFG